MRKYFYAVDWNVEHETFTLKIFHAEDYTLAYEGWTETLTIDAIREAMSEVETEDYIIQSVEEVL